MDALLLLLPLAANVIEYINLSADSGSSASVLPSVRN